MPRTLLTHARLACLDSPAGYGLIEDGAVLVEGGRIRWRGETRSAPRVAPEDEVIDCGRRLVTPGLIDCHTHLVHGGHRAREFEMRLQGESYEAISRAGGGILSTVEATRAASLGTLVDEALPRLTSLQGEGVTTVEIKSGYGLAEEAELRMLRAATRLGERTGVRVQRTLLAAHALPPEYAGRADDYIDWVSDALLPRAHEEGLVDAVDVFIEGIGFSPAQGERVFARAAALGIPVKAHVEQLSNLGGALLAARYGALSIDHIEYLEAGDVARLEGPPVAVLLPGAFLTLGETQQPPVEALREHGVPIAIATDGNPGSSPIYSLLAAMFLACTLFRLTPAEALRGVTVNAAQALGLGDSLGTLSVGKHADLVLWDLQDPAVLSYQLGGHRPAALMRAGRWQRAATETSR